MADLLETRTYQQLPPATAVSPDALIGVQEPDGPVQKLSIRQLLGRLVATDAAKETRADLLADLDHVENSIGLVYADPDPALNGWYRKTGAAEAGTWTQFEKLSAYAAGEIAVLIEQAEDSAAAAQTAADVAMALTNFRPALADAVAEFPVGTYFSSAETGELRVYLRIAGAPGYEDAGDAVAPLTRKLLEDAGDDIVGSDDGEDGALWSTVKGFIAHLRSSAGAQVVGLEQAGAGAVARSLLQDVREIRRAPKQFGAIGSGLVADDAAIALCDAAGSWVLEEGDYLVADDMTLASKLRVPANGGRFIIPDGVTLTINGRFTAGAYPVFVCSGSGKVVFGSQAVVQTPWPEWWGAAFGGGDSYAALQACLTATKRLPIKGYYTSSRGLVGPAQSVIFGIGHNCSGITVNHATDHLLRYDVDDVFIEGGLVKDITLARGVTPTTPASPADDLTQGHGIHLELVSNPRVRDVYVMNNLIEIYVWRTLAARVENTRGLRLAGASGERWTGLYVNGDMTGMPPPFDGFPSPNPSCTIKKIQMAAPSGLDEDDSINFRLKKNLQDLWLIDPEAGGGSIQFDIDPEGANAGDVHIVRPIADSYFKHGIRVRNLPLNATMEIEMAWVAPHPAATSSGVFASGAHGLKISVNGDFASSSGLRGFDCENSSQVDAHINITRCQFPAVLAAVNTSTIEARGYKPFPGTEFGTVIIGVGCANCSLIATTVVTTGQKFVAAVDLDATSANCLIDVTRTYSTTSVTNKVVINGAPVTTQGNVGGHLILNPGAGAML